MGYKACCPDGYLYVSPAGRYIDPATGTYVTVTNTSMSGPPLSSVLGKCCQFINRGFAQSPGDTIDCPCCPPGQVYINADGSWADPKYGQGTITNLIANTANKCIILTSVSNTTPRLSTASPATPGTTVTCKCCDTGYSYSSIDNLCISDTNFTIKTDPIPCITCVCTEPTPFECPDCTVEGEGIAFQYNFQERSCEVCTPVDLNPPKGPITCFMPIQFSDPNTTFILKNLNYI